MSSVSLTSDPMTSKRLPEGAWRILAYVVDDDWVLVSNDREADLTVDGEAVYGTAGLNRYTTGGTALPLGPMATTRMAGPQHLMDQEDRLLDLIQNADGVVAGVEGMFLLHQGLAVVELKHGGTASSTDDV